jgi:hypothetical protein
MLQDVTEISEVRPEPREPLPADNLAQRNLIVEVLAMTAAGTAGTAAGEMLKDGIENRIKQAASKLNPPPGKHAAGHEHPPADDRHDQDGG